MSGFKIPLNISNNSIYIENFNEDIEKSIKDFINLIVDSANGSFKPDRNFGFSLKNTRFENNDKDNRINLKKINENDSDVNSYAYDLKKVIKNYETRLLNPSVKMEFNKKNNKVSIIISGSYITKLGGKNPYQQTIKFHIW